MGALANLKSKISKPTAAQESPDSPAVRSVDPQSSLPVPAMPCKTCGAPALWLDPYSAWHCPECEPAPIQAFVRGRVLQVILSDPTASRTITAWENLDGRGRPAGIVIGTERFTDDGSPAFPDSSTLADNAEGEIFSRTLTPAEQAADDLAWQHADADIRSIESSLAYFREMRPTWLAKACEEQHAAFAKLAAKEAAIAAKKSQVAHPG